MTDTSSIVRNRIDSAERAIKALKDAPDRLIEIAETVRNAVLSGGKILTCGNGGSAAEALHLSEELIGRYEKDRPPIASICLNADPTALTCIGNDYGFDRIFSRQCEALVREGDILIVFSTSGNSANLIEALKTTRSSGGRTIGLLGRDGGEAKTLCDQSLIAPGEDSAAIQECHQVALHAICNCLEP